MILEKNLNGVWYNDNFKMTVDNGIISLNTNIDTIHKPFYTNELYNENLLWNEEDKIIKLSENITLLKSKSIHNVIVISILINQSIQLIRLVKFTE